MLAASAKFRPALAWFARQIAPSVLATLIAALVIAGYNRAFSGHLQQPRMAALHAAMDKAAHCAARNRDTDIPIKLLESILGSRFAAFAHDEMRDKARCISRLLTDAVGLRIPAIVITEIASS